MFLVVAEQRSSYNLWYLVLRAVVMDCSVLSYSWRVDIYLERPGIKSRSAPSLAF